MRRTGLFTNTCMSKTVKNEKKLNTVFLYIVSAALLVFAALASLSLGAMKTSLGELLSGAFLSDGYETVSTVIYHVRMPRVCAALICGVGLSLSGALLQSLTENPLAAPSIIGINSGAGLGVMIYLAFVPLNIGITGNILMQMFSFIFAFMTTMVVFLLSKTAGSSNSSIILSGIAVNALFNALISLITLLKTDTLVSYNSFSVGGFSGGGYNTLIIPAFAVLFSVLCSLLLVRKIDLLALGGDMASVLGVRVRSLRLICVLLASLSAAASVSVAGLVGFVGLVAPHISRKLVGDAASRSLPLSLLLGAILTTVADLVGRILIPPTEIPVGIMMAALGVPFFVVLLVRKRREYL